MYVVRKRDGRWSVFADSTWIACESYDEALEIATEAVRILTNLPDDKGDVRRETSAHHKP
jgi:hypothetical protein